MRHPMKSHRSRLVPYGVALAAVSVAVLLALWLRHSEGKLEFPLSFAAVLVSAWYGGLGARLFAAVLVGIASIYFLFPPTGSFKVTGPRDLLHLGLFALAAIVISLG